MYDLCFSDGVLFTALEGGDHQTAAQLYMQAAELADREPDAAAFYATHAFVHALQAGDFTIEQQSGGLLRRMGRLR